MLRLLICLGLFSEFEYCLITFLAIASRLSEGGDVSDIPHIYGSMNMREKFCEGDSFLGNFPFPNINGSGNGNKNIFKQLQSDQLLPNY
jgi:hypothetical protein